MNNISVSRRRFLLGGTAALLVAGCSTRRGSSGSRGEEVPRPTTAQQLLKAPLFYVAHRGSGDNWTEHSLDAYRRSLRAGAHAVEISVSTTKDGVLVCHHDPNTLRLTGVDRIIADTTWKTLSSMRLDARQWLGPKASTQPISRLEDVLEALGPTNLALVEDKAGTSTEALLDMLDSQERSTERFVWKQWAPASQYRAADERGYATWGYLTSNIVDRVGEFAGRFDALGVQTTSSDADIATVVAAGRPVIAYEVHDRSSRDRLQKLGVTGMMCSNISYVLQDKKGATSDAFATGLRSFGDLPAAVDEGWSAQPLIQPAQASVRFGGDPRTSYLMGSMCPVRPEPYRLSFQMRWPDGLPNTADHAGVAFALESDAPYVIKRKSATGGYHAVVRANGTMEILERDAGAVDATPLASVKTGPVEPGEWMKLDVLVDQVKLTFSRAGDPAWTISVDDNSHRGGFLRLCKNYDNSTPVEFSAVTVRDA
ncbi:glycerophosphodiester phosphodiesterase [Aeromicrobium sp.]|uniref:glycerophosphodiester phosphodiesterase n=1 Tax=Aeromicrobium sp. TaxID=1871063 RepID=UPI0019B8B09A|nr:glycerophosphodiester phosphodiesterase [Aeromicrobium sp.]MBC7632266.1 hypothetical protein [Aeromicrobium sp.]